MKLRPTDEPLGPLFEVGQTVAGRKIYKHLLDNELSFADFLNPHRCGDWGEVDEAQVEANVAALSSGGSIRSSYRSRGAVIRVITVPDRSKTTMLYLEGVEEGTG